jgi:TolB-like protein/Tfp pilus assembly protein PilF
MHPRNFFAELKRRNVIRAAGLYLVGAWLLVQVAGTVLPMFGAPDWLPRSIVILLAIAFVPAVIFSWVFELTPQGLKRDEDVPVEQSIAPQTGRRMDRIIIAVLLLALGYFAFDKFIVGPRREASFANTTEVRPPTKIPTASAKSIAVLPFDNLSHDPENAYFSEGIQDEILTRLAKTAELKVVSRTSTQRFKGTPGDLKQIAQQLGVTNILEGSVQKANDQVRVNVQLINALTDEHLWAETYDRKLTDTFAVESEISKTIAEKLQAKLTGGAEKVLASRPTENPEAHQLYLKGRYFWNRRTAENLRKAGEYFQQAIALDPTYALAYAGLADVYALLPIYAATAPRDEIPKALVAARKAVELDDTLAEAHNSLANALAENVQFEPAEREFRRALELNPNYATAHQWFGETLLGLGRFEEALDEVRRAHETDPLSLVINSALGYTLGSAGKTTAALEQLRKTLDMDPTFYVARFALGQVLEQKGDLEGARAEYERIIPENQTPANLASVARIYIVSGRADEGRRVLNQLTERARQGYIPSFPLAVIHLALGEKEEALTLLENSADERGIFQGSFGSIKTDKRMDPLRGDPRFEKLVANFLAGKPE